MTITSKFGDYANNTLSGMGFGFNGATQNYVSDSVSVGVSDVARGFAANNSKTYDPGVVIGGPGFGGV